MDRQAKNFVLITVVACLSALPAFADKRGGGLYFSWTWPAGAAFGISRLDMDLWALNNPTTSDVLFFSTQLYCGTPTLRNTFYFGLQTNVQGRGKGMLFSRFGTTDETNAEKENGSDAWSVSSNSEGDFVGVRKLVNWTAHHYTLSLRILRDDQVGRWFGFWLVDEDSGVETYGGALRFPKDSAGRYPYILTEGFGSFIEHATSVSTSAAVPLWTLGVGRPVANGGAYAAIAASWRYAPSDGAIWENSDIWSDGMLILARMGDDIIRKHAASQITYTNSARQGTILRK